LRCKAVWGLGHLSLNCVEISNTMGLAEIQEAVSIARQLNDPGLLARPLADEGAFYAFGFPGDADASLAEAIAAARRAGDEWAAAQALWWLAFYRVFTLNRPDLADPVFDELAQIGRRAANVGCLGWTDVVIGIAAWHAGRLEEARLIMERARACALQCRDPLLEMYAVEWQTGVRIALGEYDAGEALALQTAVRMRRSADACREGFIEFGLAEIALARGAPDEALRQADAVTDLIRGVGLPFKLVRLEALRGRAALARGDVSTARSALDAAMEVAVGVGVPWMIVDACHNRAFLARADGDPAVAEDLHHRALALEVEYGFRGVAAGTLEGLASLAAAGDSHPEAARLLGAAQALRQATGQTRWPLEQPAYEADVVTLRSVLGDEAFEQLRTDGTALSLEEAAAYASRARGERKRPRTGWAALTPTEVEVTALAAHGLTNAEIGRRLFISAGTVRIHLSHIYAKLGIANRAQLAAEATARRILPKA
jgi:DNA-binding CsgD family transcriptional regulator